LAEINWTRESEIWLRDIYNYIAADNPHAAARTVNEIYEKAQLLKNQPRLGYKYEPEQSREVRILLYQHYRIAYLIRSDGDIDVLGVFHSALDIEVLYLTSVYRSLLADDLHQHTFATAAVELAVEDLFPGTEV